MATTTKADHMNWCKERALRCVEEGKLDKAWDLMVSDLGKHPETAGHVAIGLGMMLKMLGNLNTKAEVRKFIEDFD